MSHPQLKHVQPFRCLDVDSAPEQPGLYAWYASLVHGPPDWERNLVAGEDAGKKACRSFLQRFTSRFTQAALRLEGRGSFSTIWRGDLQDATTDRLRKIISGESEATENNSYPEADEQKKLEQLFSEPSLRAALLSTLQIATPFISAPVYIGVAIDLRQRLRQHADQLYKLSQVPIHTPQERELLLQDKRFAARAIGMGFSPDTLTVWTLNLDSIIPGVSDRNSLRLVAECAEWLLNRWHRPLLGRR